jgi:hypothetical protein
MIIPDRGIDHQMVERTCRPVCAKVILDHCVPLTIDSLDEFKLRFALTIDD